jgi:hypothetical protein
MTRKTKKILFYIAVVIFIISSFFITLYAQGYKYSLKDGKFYLTGAISVKLNADAKVYLNDELEGSTSFFGASFGIDRLLPGDYALSMIRDNYSTWKKVVSVQEGLVSDFSHILILPITGEEKDQVMTEIENLFIAALPTPTPSKSLTPRTGTTRTPTPSPTPNLDPYILMGDKLFHNTPTELTQIGSSVLGFKLSENNKKIMWWTNNEVWVRWLENTDYQPFMQKDQTELITRLSKPISSALWFRGNDHIVVKMAGATQAYKILEIDKRGGVNIIDY